MLRLITWHTFARVTLLAYIGTLGAGVWLHLHTRRNLSNQIRAVAEVQKTIAEGQAIIAQNQKLYSQRLDALEKAMFGKAPAKPIIIGAQTWQEQRDRELRARLRALEEWRYRAECR